MLARLRAGLAAALLGVALADRVADIAIALADATALLIAPLLVSAQASGPLRVRSAE